MPFFLFYFLTDTSLLFAYMSEEPRIKGDAVASSYHLFKSYHWIARKNEQNVSTHELTHINV